MKIAPKNRVQRALIAGAAALALLGTAGCSAINEQATTFSYAASDGVVADIGPIDLRNLMIIAADAESPGRVLGTAANTSDSPVQLSLAVAGSTASVTVPANGQIRFEEDENETILSNPGGIPGSIVDVTVQVNSDSQVIGVPVLDGTLAEYTEFVPSGTPTEGETSTPTESATPEATEAAAETASH
ncbi:hypothetical protein [Crystallibacter degradans]|uniref:hypothetical protein n=1 Tax=Crystallibacter degradans TaxID=2726743 RepID=UPI001475908E|nr:hypothetical protein [Arthrobacter sp. SF27]NMR29340.1 hypothetical protein [Arthrobacter sp. SF27]